MSTTITNYPLQPFKVVADFLSTFNMSEEIILDCETISFNDEEPALKPYHGHRVSTIIVGQKGKGICTIPYRHRYAKTSIYDIDEVREFMRPWVWSMRDYVNQNPLFDMKFLAQDGILFNTRNCRVRDTQVLARLVRNDLARLNLEYLCTYFSIENGKSDAVKEWCKSNKTQDYGACPHEILLPYGVNDVRITANLYYKLLQLLPEESKEQWEVECKFTPLLFECEHEGLLIDQRKLMQRRITLIQDMIKSLQKMYSITGKTDFNPRSHVQVNNFFREHGVDPLKYNDEDEEAASWDKKVLVLLNKVTHGVPAAEMAEELIKFKEAAIQEATFCKGWCAHADANGVVHPDFKQAGTKSGRLSCGDPNAQNTPEWMEEAILIPEGYVGVKWDLGQIEYRKFTHYAKNPRLLESYRHDPYTDYHQLLAEVLGFPRKPVKTINFAILYGMGQKKTKSSLAKAIVDFDSPAVRTTLIKFAGDFVMPEYPEPMTPELLATLAVNVLSFYHEQLPEIKQLNKQIKDTLRLRGYVRNYYGRRIYLKPDKAYIGLNAVIQGGSADLFKRILVENHYKHPNVKMVNNVHDCDKSLVRVEELEAYWETCNATLAKLKYDIPIVMDGLVATKNWANYVEIGRGSIVDAYNQLLLKDAA